MLWILGRERPVRTGRSVQTYLGSERVVCTVLKTLERVVSQQIVISGHCWPSSTTPVSIQERSLYRIRKGLFRPHWRDGFRRTRTTGTLGFIIGFRHRRPRHPLTRLSRSFGVCGNVLSWMRSCLSGRTYTVRYAGTKSSIHRVIEPWYAVWRPLRFGVGSSAVRAVHC